MGVVKFKVGDEELGFQIKGDKPTFSEQLKIGRYLKSLESGENLETADQEPTDPKLQFDVETGIKSNALRSALGVAETKEEEDAILRKFDLTDDDFLRDKRGRLALTPTGASKFGQETDKNILIDEEGFSRYDFSDLSGIAPELIGGVGGAILGSVLLPGVGTVLGSALGAGAGAGTGQAVEELGETIAGVQRQTLSEVGSDVATEAAIGFIGDGLFGLLGKAFRGTKAAMKPGKDFTETEIKTAGKSIQSPLDEQGRIYADDPRIGVLAEEGDVAFAGLREKINPQKFADLTEREKLRSIERGGFGLLPTLTGIRAPSLVARIQAIGEKIFKTSDRLKNNNDRIRQVVDAYKKQIGVGDEVTTSEIGDILVEGIKQGNKKLLDQHKKVSEDVVKHLNDTVDQFTNATFNRSGVEEDLFDILQQTSKNTEDLVKAEFEAVDQILAQSDLATKELVPLKSIEDKLNTFLRKYQRRIKGNTPDGLQIENLARILSGQGKIGKEVKLKGKVSFEELYDIRQALSDIRMDGRTSGTVRSILTNSSRTGILDNVDQIFSDLGQGAISKRFGTGTFAERLDRGDVSTDIFNVFTRDLGADQVDEIKRAAASFSDARLKFFEAKSAQEKLFDNATIKKFEAIARREGADAVNTPTSINIFKDIIKPNNGRFVKRALNYIREFAPGGQSGDDFAERFRQRALNQFLKDAVETSNLNSVSKDFNGTAFANAIRNLGDTADELFGAQKNEILKLADEFDAVSFKNLSAEDALTQLESLNPNATFLDNMKELQRVQKQLDAQKANEIQKKVLAGEFKEIGPIEAAELLVKPNSSARDLKGIVDYYKTNNVEGYTKIKSYYINRMIDDFGESVMTDGKTLNAFADRLLSRAKDGKLQVVFGEQMGKSMEEFANILKFNAKSAEGGDLVAANIAASPFQNVGKLIKFSILGRKMLSKGYYDDIVKQYKNEVRDLRTPREKAMALGNIIAQTLSQLPGQTIQEGLNEAEKQTEALLESTGVTQNLSQLRNQLGPAIQQTRSSVNELRNVASAPNISPPAQGTQLAGVDITNPANALSLGLSPQDMAIAQRTRGTV